MAADALCQQALEAQAQDMAVEDTLYALERSFQSGGLPADVYLKQVRLPYCADSWRFATHLSPGHMHFGPPCSYLLGGLLMCGCWHILSQKQASCMQRCKHFQHS